MDLIRDLIFNLIIWWANLGVAFVYYIKATGSLVLLGLCMLYVYWKREMYEVRRTTRAPRAIKTHELARRDMSDQGPALDTVRFEAAKESFKLAAYYFGIFLLVVVLWQLTNVACVYFATMMWLAGGISVKICRTARLEMAQLAESWTIGYLLVLLAIKIILAILLSIPLSDWSRMVGTTLPPGYAGTVVSSLPSIMFMVLGLLPLYYLKLVYDKLRLYWGTKDTQEGRPKMQRTAGGKLSYYQNNNFY